MIHSSARGICNSLPGNWRGRIGATGPIRHAIRRRGARWRSTTGPRGSALRTDTNRGCRRCSAAGSPGNRPERFTDLGLECFDLTQRRRRHLIGAEQADRSRWQSLVGRHVQCGDEVVDRHRALRRRTTKFRPVPAGSLNHPKAYIPAGPVAAAGLALTLLLPQHQVHDPAPADVRPRPAAVVEDVVVVAPRVLKGVGQDRHRGEVAATRTSAARARRRCRSATTGRRRRGGTGCRRCRGEGTCPASAAPGGQDRIPSVPGGRAPPSRPSRRRSPPRTRQARTPTRSRRVNRRRKWGVGDRSELVLADSPVGVPLDRPRPRPRRG